MAMNNHEQQRAHDKRIILNAVKDPTEGGCNFCGKARMNLLIGILASLTMTL